MTQEEKNRIVENALIYINKIRVEFGLQPLLSLPRGQQNDGSQCPLARCLWEIDGFQNIAPGTIDFEDEVIAARCAGALDLEFVELSVITPDYLDDFMIPFDKGELPEYIEEDENP